MEDKLASKQELHDLELRIDSRLTLLESKMTVKIGTMLAASIAILTAIQKLI
jgi:hypothetical protein